MSSRVVKNTILQAFSHHSINSLFSWVNPPIENLPMQKYKSQMLTISLMQPWNIEEMFTQSLIDKVNIAHNIIINVYKINFYIRI